jgi:hypothetical protein
MELMIREACFRPQSLPVSCAGTCFCEFNVFVVCEPFLDVCSLLTELNFASEHLFFIATILNESIEADHSLEMLLAVESAQSTSAQDLVGHAWRSRSFTRRCMAV